MIAAGVGPGVGSGVQIGATSGLLQSPRSVANACSVQVSALMFVLGVQPALKLGLLVMSQHCNHTH